MPFSYKLPIIIALTSLAIWSGILTNPFSHLFSQPFVSHVSNKTHPCGSVNVFYTGLPPYHEHVSKQGYPPAEAEAAIKNSTRLMLNAGYNVKMLLAGPEVPICDIQDKMKGRHWHLTGVGYGMRGSINKEVVQRLEDNLMLFRHQEPTSPTVFNTNPWSFLWSVQRYYPLEGDCADSPGTDYGYEELCTDQCNNPKVRMDY